MEDEFSGTTPQLDWLLWEVSHRWEVRWALILRDAEQFGYLLPGDRTHIELCDRAWIKLIERYLVPHSYLPLPASTARLL
jgi:hypothetical protein